MSKGKGTATTVPHQRTLVSRGKTTTSKAKGAFNCKVEFYPDGVALEAPARNRANKASGKNLRSNIAGWSMASRRRMREYLLTHKLPSKMVGFSCTFTIPGGPLPAEKMKQLKNTWQIYLRRSGGCAVWRAEVQKRGAVHYHTIAGLPEFTDESVPAELRRKATKAFGVDDLKKVWMRSLSSLGPIHYDEYVPLKATDPKGIKVNGWPDLSAWPGADKYAVKVEALEDVYGAWKRYLQDHVTKAKQEQIGKDIGRHWGVIGRSDFEKTKPVDVKKMTWRQYASFLRCFNRMCTPFLKCPGAMFGKRRGFAPRRGRSGRSVVFSNPDTIKRLTDWAQALT